MTPASGRALVRRWQTVAQRHYLGAGEFYSANYLAGAREQESYTAFQGIALESEFLPDSPNHAEWPQPDCWLQPGDRWESVTRYRFTPR